MPRHQDKDLSFDTPPEWIDRSIIAHSSPPAADQNESAPNVVVTREEMRESDTLRTHADRQLLELGKQLTDFDLLESRETQLGGLPAILLRYGWTSHFGPLEQTVTLVERMTAKGRVAILFTTTVGREDAAKARPIFADMLQSVRFDQGQGQPPPPSPGPPSSQTPAPMAGPAPVVPMPG